MKRYRKDSVLPAEKIEYTWEEISKLNCTKGEFAEKIGLKNTCFDTALPQGWLDSFVKVSGLEYSKVLWSCFATYPNDRSGMKIVSGWNKVNEFFNRERNC